MTRQLWALVAVICGTATTAPAEGITVVGDQRATSSLISSPPHVAEAQPDAGRPGTDGIFIFDNGGSPPTQGLGIYGLVGWVTGEAVTPPFDTTVFGVGGGLALNGPADCVTHFEIQTDNGSGWPSGTVLGSTGPIAVSDLPALPLFKVAQGLLDQPVQLQAGETYHILFHADEGAAFVAGTINDTFPRGYAVQSLDGEFSWYMYDADVYFGALH